MFGSGHGGDHRLPCLAGMVVQPLPSPESPASRSPPRSSCHRCQARLAIRSVACRPTSPTKQGSASIAAGRFGRLVSTWNVCRRASAITAQVRATKPRLIRACPTSLMLFTKTLRGVRHRSGSSSTSTCIVMPNPGPLVRGSPSCWYFAWPIAFSRLASVSAYQWSQPGEIRSHPVVGFHVTSVHSIFVTVLTRLSPSDVQPRLGCQGDSPARGSQEPNDRPRCATSGPLPRLQDTVAVSVHDLREADRAPL